MRKLLCLYLIFFGLFIILNQSVKAESIHFEDFVYKIISSETINLAKETINYYYKNGENSTNWTQRFIVKYNPEFDNVIKYGKDETTKIETDKNKILLKFIQSKKHNVSIVTYLENSSFNENKLITYHVCKYAKIDKKGISTLDYNKKFVILEKEDVNTMVKEIKERNDDFIERMIITDIPQISKAE